MSPTPQTIVKTKKALKDLDWLSPSSDLDSCSGRDFGRNIEVKIGQISTSHKAFKINLRRRPAAVVMSVVEYEKLLAIKSLVVDLLDQGTKAVVGQAADEFDLLLARIQNPKTREIGNAFFTAEGVDLAATFKPGRTETP